MKLILILFATLFLSANTSAQIVGKWLVYPWSERYNPNIHTNVSWELSENNKLIQVGSVLDMSSFLGSYEIDTKKNPQWFDVTSSKGKVKGLLEMMGPDEMKVEFFPFPLTNEHPMQFSDIEFGSDIYLVDKNILYIQRKKTELEPSQEQKAVIIPELSKKWIGTWTKGDYIYEGELFIITNSDMKITGKILWTLLKSPNLNDTRIGKSGVEYISGSYDPGYASYVFDGIRKDDPNNVIGLDSYRLGQSLYDDILYGRTKGHDNSWVALFVLVKYGDIGKIDMPFDSIYYNQKKYDLNKSDNLEFKYAFGHKSYGPATGIIYFIKVDNQWTGTMWHDQTKVNEPLEDISISEGSLSFSNSKDKVKQWYNGVYYGTLLPCGKIIGILSRDDQYFSWTAEKYIKPKK